MNKQQKLLKKLGAYPCYQIRYAIIRVLAGDMPVLLNWKISFLEEKMGDRSFIYLDGDGPGMIENNHFDSTKEDARALLVAARDV